MLHAITPPSKSTLAEPLAFEYRNHHGRKENTKNTRKNFVTFVYIFVHFVVKKNRLYNF